MAIIDTKKILSLKSEKLEKFHITNNRYEEIKSLCVEKRKAYAQKGTYLGKSKFESTFIYNMTLNYPFLYNRSIELIKQSNLNLNNNIEKQLFINNYVFDNDEHFVKALNTYNITFEQITELINIIERKKAICIQKKDADSKMDVKDIIDIQVLAKHYGLNSTEIVINKIYELYTFKALELKELLDDLQSKKR